MSKFSLDMKSSHVWGDKEGVVFLKYTSKDLQFKFTLSGIHEYCERLNIPYNIFLHIPA